jgi:hypothetical protein
MQMWGVLPGASRWHTLTANAGSWRVLAAGPSASRWRSLPASAAHCRVCLVPGIVSQSLAMCVVPSANRWRSGEATCWRFSRAVSRQPVAGGLVSPSGAPSANRWRFSRALRRLLAAALQPGAALWTVSFEFAQSVSRPLVIPLHIHSDMMRSGPIGVGISASFLGTRVQVQVAVSGETLTGTMFLYSRKALPVKAGRSGLPSPSS